MRGTSRPVTLRNENGVIFNLDRIDTPPFALPSSAQTIALHSQVITEYCKWVGASSKLRGLLIRKAKRNGDDLGFLW